MSERPLSRMKPYRMIRAGVAFGLLFWIFEAIVHTVLFRDAGVLGNLVPHDVHEWYSRSMVFLLLLTFGGYAERARRRAAAAEAERAALDQQLQVALTQALSGFLPVCAWCKQVRDAEQSWQPLEVYLRTKTNVKITHGMCPSCFAAQCPPGADGR